MPVFPPYLAAIVNKNKDKDCRLHKKVFSLSLFERGTTKEGGAVIWKTKSWGPSPQFWICQNIVQFDLEKFPKFRMSSSIRENFRKGVGEGSGLLRHPVYHNHSHRCDWWKRWCDRFCVCLSVRSPAQLIWTEHAWWMKMLMIPGFGLALLCSLAVPIFQPIAGIDSIQPQYWEISSHSMTVKNLGQR